MCKSCSCGAHSGAAEIHCVVAGYTDANAKQVEHSLLGLPGVLNVHIHAHDGSTAIQYQAAKTSLQDIQTVFTRHNLAMNL